MGQCSNKEKKRKKKGNLGVKSKYNLKLKNKGKDGV